MDIFVIALLVLLGIVLLAVEIALIPGIGITGVMGVLSLVAAVFYAFFVINSLAGWITLLIVLLASVSLFLWAVYGDSIDKVALKKNIDSTVKDNETNTLKVGDKGIATTRLALIGEADFGGVLAEVKSSDGFIEEGTSIVVERISGGIFYVKKYSE